MSSLATTIPSSPHRLGTLVRGSDISDPTATPFVALYLTVSWGLYLPFVRPRGGRFSVDKEPIERFLYSIPGLSDVRLGVVRSPLAAPIFNHDLLQILCVSALLLILGSAVAREVARARPRSSSSARPWSPRSGLGCSFT